MRVRGLVKPPCIIPHIRTELLTIQPCNLGKTFRRACERHTIHICIYQTMCNGLGLIDNNYFIFYYIKTPWPRLRCGKNTDVLKNTQQNIIADSVSGESDYYCCYRTTFTWTTTTVQYHNAEYAGINVL